MREMALGRRRPAVDHDADLVEALRRREAAAAEALIAAYGDRAYRLAIGITGNRADAEEVVQEAFWTVIQKIDTFRGDAAFGSWLYRITANCAYTKLRVRRARHHESSLDEVSVLLDEHAPSIQDWPAHVEDPALQSELRTVLTAAIDTLPEGYRAILVLRDVEGLSLQNVSQITGLSVAAVKTRTHRVRLVLRKWLGEYLSGRPLSLPPSPSGSPPSPRRGEWPSASTRTQPPSGRCISSGRRISSSLRWRSAPAARPPTEADRKTEWEGRLRRGGIDGDIDSAHERTERSRVEWGTQRLRLNARRRNLDPVMTSEQHGA
jgi:RNA polymerase sigma-70 factor (ECF subfamily)